MTAHACGSVRDARQCICIIRSVSFSMIVAGGRALWLTGTVYGGDGGRSVTNLLLKLLSVVVNVVRLCKLFALTDFVKTRHSGSSSAFVSTTVNEF